MTNDDETRGRRRLGRLGVLLALLLALGGYGYAVSSSPSASTGPGTKPSATPSIAVLGPKAPGSAASPDPAPTGSTNAQVALAPAGNGNAGGSTANCVEPSNGNGNCEKRFGVTVGQTQPLYPSLTRSLPVTFSNPNSFDILVTTYRVSVSVPTSSAASCPASSLEVPSGTVTLSPRLTAPKKGSVVTAVPIKLSADAPEGCQQVSFTITVDASAVKK